MKKKEKEMMGSEHEEQVALFEWAEWNKRTYPELELMFAIPNGGQRHVVVAKKLKDEGVQAGVPDVFLPVARFRSYKDLAHLPSGACCICEEELCEDGLLYHGLFIEMKVGKNKLTQNQDEWIDSLVDEHYMCAVCYGAEEAINVLEWYLSRS